MSSLVWFTALLALYIVAAINSEAAYRNGVCDGARNRWQPKVKKILGETTP